jgi:hypothetical protein
MRVLKSYLFWTYERGSFHYDVMVTLILLFIFLSPRWINYKDKPAERLPAQGEVMVQNGPGMGLIYQVNAKSLDTRDGPEQLQTSILRVIEPISGGVTVDRTEPVNDANGKLVAYRVWVRR